MRKLKLSIDTLAVQSFDTAPIARGRGTVHGKQIDAFGVAVDTVVDARTHPDCPSPLCVDTPLASCDGTCGAPGCY
jgi:hypothetical protein